MKCTHMKISSFAIHEKQVSSEIQGGQFSDVWHIRQASSVLTRLIVKQAEINSV